MLTIVKYAQTPRGDEHERYSRFEKRVNIVYTTDYYSVYSKQLTNVKLQGCRCRFAVGLIGFPAHQESFGLPLVSSYLGTGV